jgi:RND family efflux transporter MFP subunit
MPLITKGRLLFGLIVVAGGGVWAASSGIFGPPEEVAKWFPPVKWFVSDKAAAGNAAPPAAQRAVPVEVATAVKKTTPVLLGALGNVTTIASVAVRPRLDNEIVGIHFSDGAFVKQGDLLVTLDARSLEAQVGQAEGNLARDKAQLAQAERDVRRTSDLLGKGAGPQLNVETAQTQVGNFMGAVKADTAALDNLKVLLSYCTIKAAISGRISQASIKIGNFARSADAVPIATINQIAPIYVTFSVSQRSLPELRAAMAQGETAVDVTIPGDQRSARGIVTMVENTVDATTGLATVRATMPNKNELLWPGTLVNVNVILRNQNAVVVPTPATR